MANVILGLGSNLDERINHLQSALRQIGQLCPILNISSLYESDAQLIENAPPEWSKPYLNMAIEVETPLPPQELLSELKKIEKDLGRPTSKERWAPRTIDIDILDYNEALYETENLCIPHLHLAERPFALLPLLELKPLYNVRGKLAQNIADSWQKSTAMPFNTYKRKETIEL